jgi:uncharacterized protein (TIGR00730 family)
MKSVCVFCGSSSGANGVYLETARELGRIMAGQGVRLVYGGADVGLMGAVADAALEAGGEVVGVIPDFLQRKELAHKGLTELVTVDSMHERKARMADLSDGFIALPGGMGTLEEFCEVVTWAQLGLHKKPCGLLNAAGYYAPLMEFFERMTTECFIKEAHKNLVLAASSPAALLETMRDFKPVTVEKWIDRDKT